MQTYTNASMSGPTNSTTSDWIRVTTTSGTGTNSAGWYTVNWGPTIKKDPKDDDRFYSSVFGRYLLKSKVITPERIKPCWAEMIKLLSNQDMAKKMFQTKQGAILALTSFKAKHNVESQIFKMLAKHVYSEELSERR